jgi:hypothetical protein
MGTKLTDDELKAREDTVALMETLIRDMETMLYKDRSAPVGGGRIASKARAEMDKDRTCEREGSGRQICTSVCVCVCVCVRLPCPI